MKKRFSRPSATTRSEGRRTLTIYRVVLLDIDGTLVDSNDAHAQVCMLAFAAHGRRLEFSRARPLIGKGGDKLLRELAGIEADSEEGRAIFAIRRRRSPPLRRHRRRSPPYRYFETADRSIPFD
jgi:beta-phosphoglucomutase-like phosphatase (HAD superfamily)